jgi:hypothetical protein
MNNKKSKADVLAEKLDEMLIKKGLPPAKKIVKTGYFVTVHIKFKPDNVIINVKAENRMDFISKIVNRGFKIDKIFSRDELINSYLPITLNFKANEIGIMGNITCAAAASSQGMILSEEEFWKMM